MEHLLVTSLTARDEPADASSWFALLERPAWHDQALCREHPEVQFFTERGEATGPAKRVCAACPVRDDCLEHALAEPEKFGIWGGMSERERRALRKRKKASRAA